MLPVETLKIGSEEATVVATTAETGGDLFALGGLLAGRRCPGRQRVAGDR